MKGLCPFHQEKTPSFSVDPENQLFYCFGCQTGGDVFKFVMLYDKVGFGEALESLAKRFGVPLPKVQRRPDDPHERMMDLNRTAESWFTAMLQDERAGAGCREYVKRRGISDETRERLRLGYAPDSWDALRSHLQSRRFSPEEIVRGGLGVPRRKGPGQYDRFRNRLMFPIHDAGGHTVAFGGRTLGDDDAKYINSPETPTYTKGEHLYGFDLARTAIRREGFAIVVEGYLDLAALVQAGFDNVVASLGTAFTPSQARLLARLTQRVVVSYDGDAAGTTATKRSLDLLLERGFDVHVVDLPAGQDPDDYIKQQGAEAYGRLVRDAPTYLQFLLQAETRSRDLTRLEDKVAAVNAMLPHVARLGNSIERSAWAGRLADVLQIEEGLVLQELRVALKHAQPRIRQRPDRTTQQLREAEARLVALLLRSEAERLRWSEELDPVDLKATRIAPIVETILGMTRDGASVDAPAVLAAMEDDKASCELLTRIAFRDEPEEGPDVEDCLWAFRRASLQREGRKVVREMTDIKTDAADDADVNQRLLRIQQLAKQRDALY